MLAAAEDEAPKLLSHALRALVMGCQRISKGRQATEADNVQVCMSRCIRAVQLITGRPARHPQPVHKQCILVMAFWLEVGYETMKQLQNFDCSV